MRASLCAMLFFVGCSARVVPKDLHAMPTLSIDGSVTWQGTVHVDRIVVVRRAGHLTLAPGTKVLFHRVDWDGDGIGDAEITVEGRLTAVGSPAAPILFASAEADPRPSDWKYVMVNFAAGADIGFARFAHAYSGIQVHYSPANIYSCEFTRNVDGVRFSTARLKLEGSWLHGNVNGIRFEERGYPGHLVGNEISGNEVGIFAVTQCRSESVFRENNIRSNRYPVKLGWEQTSDLSLPGNHWGDTPEKTLESVLDGRTDPTLGKVNLLPALSEAAPVKIPPFTPPGDPEWERL